MGGYFTRALRQKTQKHRIDRVFRYPLDVPEILRCPGSRLARDPREAGKALLHGDAQAIDGVGLNKFARKRKLLR